MRIRINEIIVGERRREDMGDLQGLAESISKHGLLHPIVVDEQNRLVAGGRRLAACKLLGWHEVEITSVGELSEKELRVIELEENLRRKDLTEYEKSRNMVELAEIKAEQLKSSISRSGGDQFSERKEENEGALNPCVNSIESEHEDTEQFLPSVGRNPKGGRPKKQDSQEAIAKELGVPRQTLQDAYTHLRAVEEFPELKELPKTHVIEIAKQLRSTPEPVRQEKLQQLRVVQEEGERKIAQIDHEYKIRKTIDDAIGKMCCLTLDPERLDIWLKSRQFNELAFKETELDTAIRNITVLKKYLQSVKQGPRLVSGGGKA